MTSACIVRSARRALRADVTASGLAPACLSTVLVISQVSSSSSMIRTRTPSSVPETARSASDVGARSGRARGSWPGPPVGIVTVNVDPRPSPALSAVTVPP